MDQAMVVISVLPWPLKRGSLKKESMKNRFYSFCLQQFSITIGTNRTRGDIGICFIYEF
jgi:hypothetical protein